MTSDSLRAYLADRETLLAEIIKTLSADERFVAAWLAGSFGRDDADAVSDLDLTVVVSDPYSERLCAHPRQVSAQTTKERFDLINKFGQPAVLYENNHNAPEGGTPQYQRGSVSPLAATPEGQVKAIYHLSERMLKLMPEVAKLGGYVPPSPLPTIKILLNLANGK
jgi:predicted nucleotidyltransferase